jgi:hypothetical protein
MQPLGVHGLEFQHAALCARRCWLHLHRAHLNAWSEHIRRGEVRHAESHSRDRSVWVWRYRFRDSRFSPGRNATSSPSSMAVVTGRRENALATRGNRSAQSSPLRVSNRTRPRLSDTMNR